MNDSPGTLQDAHYRRGVVLGLTMGEAILLLLFTLLLVLAVPLIRSAEKTRELEKALAERSREYEALTIRLAALNEAITKIGMNADGKGIEDLTKEYVLSKSACRRWKNG